VSSEAQHARGPVVLAEPENRERLAASVADRRGGAAVQAAVPTGRSWTTIERPYSSSWDEHTATLHIHGTLDELSAHAFRDDLLTKLPVGGSMVVGVTDVDLVARAAVGALVAAMKQATAAGSPIEVLVAAGGVAQRVLTICGLPHRPARADPASARRMRPVEASGEAPLPNRRDVRHTVGDGGESSASGALWTTAP
jgi:anti-anti-sigma regulatory factor